jgi:hypothetical protein
MKLEPELPHWSNCFQSTMGKVIGKVINPRIIVGKIPKKPVIKPKVTPVEIYEA